MNIGSHAVVIGAGMSGLFAARVLAELYERVTVFDRDHLPTAAGARDYVPQGRHVHYLQTRGTHVVRELFPGLIEELVAQGVPAIDPLVAGVWIIDGCRLKRTPSGLQGLGITRPRLEYEVRRRVSQLPNVRIEAPCRVIGLSSSDGHAITGVVLRQGEGDGQRRMVAADLVVDASGRGSRMSEWLAELGFPLAAEEKVGIDVGYASCLFELPAGAFNKNDVGIVISATVDNLRAAALARVEDGHWQVSLTGYLGNYPPVTHQAFLDFAAALPLPDIYDALRTGRPLHDPVRYRVPYAARRHYERLKNFPERLIVLGDSACHFNPLYGQGMAVAGLEALALRRFLSGRPKSTQRFRRIVARTANVAWTFSVNGDLRLPGVPGPRSLFMRLTNAYLAHLCRAAQHDAVLARTFLRVAHLVEPPFRIFQPNILLRVLLGNLRGETKKAGRIADEFAKAPQ